MTPRVRDEWRARIAAEYTSAAVTQHLVLWLIQAGAPPDLIDAGLAIVADELVHSRMSHDVYVAAGGTAPPALDRDDARPRRARSAPLELDILRVAVRVFCLGETVAVPLFRHLREPLHRARRARRPRSDPPRRGPPPRLRLGPARLAALGRSPVVPRTVTPRCPRCSRSSRRRYGAGNQAVAGDDGEMTRRPTARGASPPPRDYAQILGRTIEKDYAPRFAARGIALAKCSANSRLARRIPTTDMNGAMRSVALTCVLLAACSGSGRGGGADAMVGIR